MTIVYMLYQYIANNRSNLFSKTEIGNRMMNDIECLFRYDLHCKSLWSSALSIFKHGNIVSLDYSKS